MFNNMLMGAAGESIKSTSFSVDNSAMFDFASAEYLTRTPTTAGNRRTWTWSGWVKRSGLGNPGGPNTSHDLFGVGAGSRLRFTSGDALRLESPSGNHTFITTQLFRDPHAWYHIVLAFDSTQATDTNRRKLYVNGSQVTDFSSTTFTELGQNAEWDINSTSEHQIAKSNLADYFGGYLAEIVLVDGSALGPTSFGETDDNGVWRPISIEDAGLTFGTNGFYLPFTNSAGLGQDYSGSTSTTVVQKNTYNAGSEINNGDAGADPSTGMLFIPPVSGTVSKIELNASSRGFSGVTVRLETDGGSGTAPSGTIVTNGEVTGITSSGAGLKTATFSTPPEVVAGTKYWIVLRGDTGTWGWQHDVSGVGGALGLYQGGQGYFSGRGVGHYVYMTGNHYEAFNSPTQTTDTCTDNHCTWSPIISYNKGVSFSEGNSRSTTSTSSGDVGGLIGSYELPTSGKYYWEWVTNDVGTTPLLGWTDIINWNPNATSTGEEINAAKFITGNDYNTGDGRILSSTIDGSTSLSQASYGNFLTVSGGNPLANGTVLGCAYDADNGLAWFSYNNTWVDGNGTDSSSTVKGEIEAGTSGSQAFTTANGAVGEAGLFITASVQSVSSGDFTLRTRSDQWTGDCPSGFTALSTKNQAAAVTFAIEDGSVYHQTTLYTGNGASSHEINQSGENSTFTPDWVWLKGRTTTEHRLFDVLRGATKTFFTDSSLGNSASTTEATTLLSFDSDGFTVGSNNGVNSSGDAKLAWQWKAGDSNTAVSASGSGDGYINACTHRANQTAGFSLVKYTGANSQISNGQDTKVTHGLGAKPELAFIKNMDDTHDWRVLSTSTTGFASDSQTGDDAHLTLNSNAIINGSLFTGHFETGSDSTHFEVGNDNSVNKNGNEFMAFLFRSIPGYCKVTSYEGNGNANGPFVDLGFKASWILFKRYTGSTASWAIYDKARDPFNAAENMMLVESTAGDNVGNKVDILSNGVKIRGTSGAYNGSGNEYLVLAFAEHPFAGTTPITAR